MGARGPMPKPADTRRRRNLTPQTTAGKTVPAHGRKGRTPKPPFPLDGYAAGLAGAEWRRLWHLPIAELWTDGDAGAVARLAVLSAQYMTDPTADTAARLLPELRALETALGVTLAARERLGVVIVDDVPTAPASPASTGTAGDTPTRFGDLRAI